MKDPPTFDDYPDEVCLMALAMRARRRHRNAEINRAILQRCGRCPGRWHLARALDAWAWKYRDRIAQTPPDGPGPPAAPPAPPRDH